MFSFGTERTYVARGLVDQTMSDHLIFPLEPLTPFRTVTSLHRTVVGSVLRVDVFMRALELTVSMVLLIEMT